MLGVDRSWYAFSKLISAYSLPVYTYTHKGSEIKTSFCVVCVCILVIIFCRDKYSFRCNPRLKKQKIKKNLAFSSHFLKSPSSPNPWSITGAVLLLFLPKSHNPISLPFFAFPNCTLTPATTRSKTTSRKTPQRFCLNSLLPHFPSNKFLRSHIMINIVSFQ